MPLPLPPNATCDVYRLTNNPPSAPDIPGVRFYLREEAALAAEHVEGSVAQLWTHVGLFDLDADIRHDAAAIWTAGDSLYVPDQNGTGFRVLMVVRAARGTPHEHKKAFLRLLSWTWPTTEL